jgi:YidC/Oxa1 family membrane protein insertase
MPWLGMDLSKRASQGQGGEVIGLYLLVILTVVTGYYQQRQMTARTPASAQNPQMQMMGKIFPLFFGFISLQIPAGVVLYFVVSNLWQIGQQAIIFRQQDREEAAKKAGGGGGKGTSGAITATATPKAPNKPSGGGGEQGSGNSGGDKPSGGSSSANRPGGSGSGGASSNRNRRRKRRRRGR